MEFPTSPRGRALGVPPPPSPPSPPSRSSPPAAPSRQAATTPARAPARAATESIAFVPKQLNNPYTDVVLGGGEEASKAIGYDYASSARSRPAPPRR